MAKQTNKPQEEKKDPELLLLEYQQAFEKLKGSYTNLEAVFKKLLFAVNEQNEMIYPIIASFSGVKKRARLFTWYYQ